jgi:hypothetical protein
MFLKEAIDAISNELKVASGAPCQLEDDHA